MKISSLQKGLVGHWTMSQDSLKGSLLADKTPYENDGIIHGATFTTDRKGKANSAMYFDGVNDYIRIADSASFAGGSTMSVYTWVKASEQTEKTIVSSYEYTLNKRSFRIQTDASGIVKAQISDDGRRILNASSTVSVLDDKWHLIGFTFNAGVLKLYVDGVENKSETSVTITSIYDSDSAVTIGCSLSSDSPATTFTGLIGETRIYNRALSQAEITTLYNSYNSKIQL